MPYKTIEDIKKANKNRGHHFFEKDTLHFFDSRVESRVYGGRFFVTSEQDHGATYEMPRRFTVRRCEDDGTINTATDFHPGFPTLQEAATAMVTLVEAEGATPVEDDGSSDLLLLAAEKGLRFKGDVKNEVTLYYQWRQATFEYGHDKPLEDLRYTLEELIANSFILSYEDTPRHFAEWAHDLGYDSLSSLERWKSDYSRYPLEEAVKGWEHQRAEAARLQELLGADFKAFQEAR
jgi:hypothetical protein